MPEDVAVAAPSAAPDPIIADGPIELPKLGTEAYAEWRNSGNLPSKEPKAEVVDTPSTDSLKEASTDSPDSEPGTKQETRRKPGAEARIAELTARTRQLEKDLEEARKPKEAKADPPPARQPEPDAKPRVEDKNQDGTPKYKDYEEFVEALADWKTEQKIAAREKEQSQRQQLESVKKTLEEARTRYEDYDSKANPVVRGLLSDGVSREVFQA